MLFNTLKECKKISYIEVIVELKYLARGVSTTVQAKRNVFEKQKNEIIKN